MLPMLRPVLCVFAVLVLVPVYLEFTAESLLAVVPVELLVFFVCAELPVLLAPVDVLGLVYFEFTAELFLGDAVPDVLVELELEDEEEEPPKRFATVL